MARVQGDDLVLEPQGRILVHVDGADVTYFQSDGVTPLTIYDSEVGGSVVGQPLTTIYGRVEPVGGGDWWHEPGVRIRHVTHPDGRTLPPLRQEAYSALDAEHLSVVREAPLSILDDRFGGDNTGTIDSSAALAAIETYRGDTYGADVLIPPGRYRWDTEPVILKPGMHVRADGRPTIVSQKAFVVQADDFGVTGVRFEKRVGAVEADARAIYLDPDGAGRDIEHFRFDDVEFYDYFYAIDGRGSSSHKVRDVEYNARSERVSAGNAGHFNWFWCEDVIARNCHTKGGQNSASHNFGNGGGYLQVIGGSDKDNYVSGGAVNFENIAGSARAQVFGGVWGYGIPSGVDAFVITADDSGDVELVAPDCGGYIRIQTSSGIVNRVKILGGYATRLRVQHFAGGTPQYIDDLDVLGLTLRGVPGFAAEAGISLDGNYLRRGRLLGCTVKRFQEDGVTENWTDDALSIARGANLDMEVEGCDFRGQSVTASGSGGKVDFGLRNRNYSSLSGIVKAPPVLPVVTSAPTDAMFAEYELRNGMTVIRTDTTPKRLHSRIGVDTWPYVELT